MGMSRAACLRVTPLRARKSRNLDGNDISSNGSTQGLLSD
jgi:hypothetical protein